MAGSSKFVLVPLELDIDATCFELGEFPLQEQQKRYVADIVLKMEKMVLVLLMLVTSFPLKLQYYQLVTLKFSRFV